MTKKLKKFLVCIISVFCVAALGVAIGCADSSSSSTEREILTDAEERGCESDNLPINDPSCCEDGHMVQTLAASKVPESHQSHSSAVSSSTTTLSSGNWYLSSDVRLNSYINVTGSVHLCLNGHTLTGGSNSVIVVNSGGTLYLHDCQGSGKITGGVGSNIIWTTGGTSQSMGGGITVANGGTLHMYGGTITGNKAGAFGGGVVVAHNSNMIMYGGTISDNTGGWLGCGGVGVLGYFLMTGGTISGNNSSSGSNGLGGGVSADTEGSYAGSVEITGGTISDNSAVQGGGVYAYTGTSLKITGGTISGNSATSEGGGVYSLVNTTISGATITGNTTTISSSSYGGGGISVPYGTATISNCTITDNKASNGCGGGICVNSGCTATLSGCTITGNSAGKYGNGIYFSGTLKISGKMVVHANPDKNSTQQDIYLSSGQYVTLGGNLSSGSDVGIYFASSSQTQVTTSESSTSYYKNSYSYFFPDSKSGYFATYSSYVYFTNSNGYFLTSFKLTSSVSTSRTYNDLSTAVGTASSAYDSAATVTVQKAVSVSSTVTIASGTSVTFDTAGYKITGPSSSYLFNVKGTLSIKGKGTITGCSSSYGAIYVPSGGSLSIQDVTISGNYSSGYGGGVYIASSSASFTMSSGYIQNNTAKSGGAGIYLASKATATFTGGTVYNNTVSGSANNIYL
ncbi:MAG: right-handed parallel beta-helix repeat-containing protein, partial [Clostridia bacterium]|nr:right-handed parallel beta-helix repeat-containing protein [Clostridia bacterium]